MEKQAPAATDRVARYFREIRVEFKKIVWPNLHQTTLYTISVVAMTAVVAALVFVADWLFQLLLGHL